MKTINIILIIIFSIGIAIILNSCGSIPKKAKAVENFDVNQYLGTWYEIARFDFRFEKELDNVSAQYSLNEKGNVKVLNSGYNTIKKEWTKAEGIAKFRREKGIAALKVSFFGPFYSGYNVISIDGNYQYALIAGKNIDYIWILSRTKDIPEEIKTKYLKIATEIGYDTSKFIWVNHDKDNNPFLNKK